MNTDKKYQVIYADPPWKFTDSSHLLVKGGGWGTVEEKGRNNDKEKVYPTLTKQELMELKINKYQIVYADPPWDYGKSSLHFTKGGFDIRGDGRNLDYEKEEKQYPTMDSSDIAELPIKDLIDKDAICFMWTTDTHMPEALEIMKAWGFTYKTIGFVWVKKEKSGKQVKMMAPWTNKGAEICLLGTRGAMTKHMKARNVSQVVEATRTKHSKKPDFIAEEIARMFPDCNRIELFARDAKPGWDVWGNEIQNTIEL